MVSLPGLTIGAANNGLVEALPTHQFHICESKNAHVINSMFF
jgi:hypothetical protein